MQVGFKKYGQSGIEISDWWPHLATCVDDLCFVRNMWTTDNDHAAENQIHTGRHRLDETQPSLGAWVHYGLGHPQREPAQVHRSSAGRANSTMRPSIDSYYLGPQHAGVPLALDPTNPLPFGRRVDRHSEAEQRHEYELIGRLNELSAVEYPEDQAPAPASAPTSWPSGCRRPSPRPSTSGPSPRRSRSSTGWTRTPRSVAGQRLLAARRLVERGVRFVQVYPSALRRRGTRTRSSATITPSSAPRSIGPSPDS